MKSLLTYLAYALLLSSIYFFCAAFGLAESYPGYYVFLAPLLAVLLTLTRLGSRGLRQFLALSFINTVLIGAASVFLGGAFAVGPFALFIGAVYAGATMLFLNLKVYVPPLYLAFVLVALLVASSTYKLIDDHSRYCGDTKNYFSQFYEGPTKVSYSDPGAKNSQVEYVNYPKNETLLLDKQGKEYVTVIEESGGTVKTYDFASKTKDTTAAINSNRSVWLSFLPKVDSCKFETHILPHKKVDVASVSVGHSRWINAYIKNDDVYKLRVTEFGEPPTYLRITDIRSIRRIPATNFDKTHFRTDDFVDKDVKKANYTYYWLGPDPNGYKLGKRSQQMDHGDLVYYLAYVDDEEPVIEINAAPRDSDFAVDIASIKKVPRIKKVDVDGHPGYLASNSFLPRLVVYVGDTVLRIDSSNPEILSGEELVEIARENLQKYTPKGSG